MDTEDSHFGKERLNIPMLNLPRLQKKLEKPLLDALMEVYESAKYINAEETSQFEQKLMDYSKKGYAIGVGSCTDALYIALRAYGIGEGMEVITIPNSFYATTEAVLRCGAKPVMADIVHETQLMDLSLLPELINSRTKAIMPTHMYGNVVDVEKIHDILKNIGRTDIIIVEDCAHAFGSRLRGKLTPIGECGAFSFNPGKNCGAFSDAGAVITSNKEVAGNSKLIRDHGRSSKNTHECVGLNSRLTAINNAVLSVKIQYIDEWNARRREIAEYYSRELKVVSQVETLVCSDEVESAYHQYVILAENREELIAYLQKNGISTGIHYPVLIPHQPVFKALVDGEEPSIPVACSDIKRILSLPCYPELTDTEVKYIANKVKEFYKI